MRSQNADGPPRRPKVTETLKSNPKQVELKAAKREKISPSRKTHTALIPSVHTENNPAGLQDIMPAKHETMTFFKAGCD